MASGGHKAIVAALVANGGITIAKFVGFALTGAASMLAEAVHSVADTGNQALLLFGASRASRPETDAHPFGYGRERYFWAFIVALVIFMLGGVFAMYEGWHKLSEPVPLKSPGIAIGILAVAILLEGWSFRTAVREARPLKGDRTWMEFIRRTKAAELPVVLLEDLGAMVGLVLALAGIGLALLTGDPRFDAMGSIAVGVLLTVIAVLLAVEMRSLLLGEAASTATLDAIRDAMLAGPHLTRVHHMRTTHLAPDELLVAAKIELAAHLSFADVAAEINGAEARIREAVPIARLIYLEPDVHRPAAD